MTVRVFWWHPCLRDYRLPLFRIMCSNHEIRFLFHEPSPLDEQFAHVHSKRGGSCSPLRTLPFEDVRHLCDGIKWADVFVSSFVWCSYTLAGLLIAKLKGKSVIVWEEINMLRPGRKDRIKQRLLRSIVKHVDAFFVLGDIQKRTLLQLGVAPERIFVANEYPGLEYGKIAPKEVELPIDKDSVVIMFIGRLIEVKGVDYLIQAFALFRQQFPRVELLIVGDGPLREDLQNLVTRLNLKDVHFVGEITDASEKAYLFRRSMVVVIPSITTKTVAEGGPLVVLEALSAGTPVIVSDAAGSSTALVVEGANGYVVPQRDVAALFERMKCVIQDQPISAEQVLATFRQIRGHNYQAEQLTKGIDFALSQRRAA
jgi:glycosyltransferase involved in cell wall biosynthesis